MSPAPGASRLEDRIEMSHLAPSATKEEIVRNYRRKIQQCHPDRVAGLAPEFLELAEEHSKALNAAYAQAIRTCR
jgi:curved DNA-binding protein CbpA